MSWAVVEGLLRLNPLAVDARSAPAPAEAPSQPGRGASSPRRRCSSRRVGGGCVPASARLPGSRSEPVRRRAVAAAGPPGGGLRGTAGRAGGAAAVGPGRPGPHHPNEACQRASFAQNQSGRTRRVTLGSGTADMIRGHFQAWAARVEPERDWLFSPLPRRSTHLTADALSHRLTRLGPASGVEHPALHRLRHGVATYLVDQGRLLKAQARLGHRDPATTLRHYSHATPLDDTDPAEDSRASRGSRRPRLVNPLTYQGVRKSVDFGLAVWAHGICATTTAVSRITRRWRRCGCGRLWCLDTLEVVVFYVEPTASITDARLEIGGVPFRCGQRQVNVDQLVVEVLRRAGAARSSTRPARRSRA